ncbi:MAG: hypothetical protein GX596_10095, partial [Propionibacterium sp.]|nr:hypothetical protein [Propionibacterium sp.]
MWLLMEVHWPLAARVARLGHGDLPDVTRPEVAAFVADLKQQARAAGELAARVMRLDPSQAATDIRVVDRDGWVRAASGITQAALDVVEWPRRSAGLRRELVRRGLGTLLGVGFAVGSRWLLGQYDSFTGSKALYLVAPNMWNLERARGFVPRDFRRWVAAHEQAHALQFAAAPWLTDHLAELVGSAEQRGTLDRVVATMTFLEGHADWVSDNTRRIRTASRMRRSLAHKPRRGRGPLDKAAQYANGREFCLVVRKLSTHNALMAAF